METLNRKQYTLRLLMLYIIPAITFIIIITVLIFQSEPVSQIPSTNVKDVDLSTLASIIITPFAIASIIYALIFKLLLIYYIIVTPLNIVLVTKRLNDIKVNKVWRVFIIIPIIGQIISILLIFPKSKKPEAGISI